MFKEYNINPKKRKTSDCVIRAIATAFEISWDKVFDELVKIAKEKKVAQISKEAYEELLKGYATIPVKYETPDGKKRYKPKNIVKWEGIYILCLAGHLTCVKNHMVYDTFDCSEKSCYKIWKVK